MSAEDVIQLVKNAKTFSPDSAPPPDPGNGKPHRLRATGDDGPARSFDGADLLTMNLPDPRFLCRPWVSEGVTLVVGRPKIGKTTLLRQIAVAGNTGGNVFGAACERADVLFLSLEEGERLMRSKLRAMKLTPEMMRGIRFEFAWPQGAAGAKKLRERLAERAAQDRRLPVVVIDSLTRFRLPPPDRGNLFVADYEAVKSLAELAKDFPGLVVLVLHHTTKATPDDPVAAISGTYGLTAAADNYLILLKQGTDFRLHAGGRLWFGDSEDFELRREGGRWELGAEWSFAAAGATPKQRQILGALRSGAKTGAAIAREIGAEESSVRHLCGAMATKGLVERVANGWRITS